MSPASRRRKAKKSKSAPQRPRVGLPGVFQDGCECPECSSEDFDPRQLIEELASGSGLTELEDPLDAEVMGAQLVSVGETLGEAFDEALLGGFIPQFEAGATTGALAMLLAIGSVTEGRVAKAAAAAADRLADAGIPKPPWADELREPVTVGDCWRFIDSQRTGSMLACSFHRAGRSHAVVMSANHLDCGAATAIHLLGGDLLPSALELIKGGTRGVEIVQEALEPAEFRWHVESALDARAVHDNGPSLFPAGGEADDDDDPISYPAMAVLMRTRMRALPVPDRPRAPHPDDGDARTLSAALEALVQSAGNGHGALALPGSGSRAMTARLPAKRKKSEQPAPVYQLKIVLVGAKPPIWRRLEVPADTSLDRLHEIIQVAFDWDDCHLHVFETSHGEFGIGDAELGHRPAAAVTLEQVAPGAGSRLRYTYDFGDSWEHDIVVEKVLEPDTATNYPRCTGGRRAAPPEDCGGIWGYADLEEILADPDHPEHEERLEWLGLDTAADFDPAHFDAAEVTKALAYVR